LCVFSATIKMKFNINLAQNDEGRKKHIDIATRSSHPIHQSIRPDSSCGSRKNVSTGDWWQAVPAPKKM